MHVMNKRSLRGLIKYVPPIELAEDATETELKAIRLSATCSAIAYLLVLSVCILLEIAADYKNGGAFLIIWKTFLMCSIAVSLLSIDDAVEIWRACTKRLTDSSSMSGNRPF